MSEAEPPVSDLLATRRVSEAGRDFWSALEARLADGAVPTTNGAREGASPDPALVDVGASASVEHLPRRRLRRRVVAVAASVAAVAVGLAALGTMIENESPTITDNTPTTTGQPTTTTAPSRDDRSSGPEALDVSASVTSFSFGEENVGGLSAEGGALWAISELQEGERASRELVRIDPGTGRVVARIEMPDRSSVLGMISGNGAVWVLAADGSLHGVDPATDTVVTSVPVFDPGEAVFGGGSVTSEAVWLAQQIGFGPAESGAEYTNVVRRVDPVTETVAALVPVPDAWWHNQIAASELGVWTASADRVDRIDPVTNDVVASVSVPRSQNPGAVGAILDLVADREQVWVIRGDLAVRIDPFTDSVISTVELRDVAMRAVLVEGYLLVGTTEKSILRIDTSTDTLDAIIDLGPTGPTPLHLVVVGDHLWFDSQGPSSGLGLESGVGLVSLEALLPPAS